MARGVRGAEGGGVERIARERAKLQAFEAELGEVTDKHHDAAAQLQAVFRGKKARELAQLEKQRQEVEAFDPNCVLLRTTWR